NPEATFHLIACAGKGMRASSRFSFVCCAVFSFRKTATCRTPALNGARTTNSTSSTFTDLLRTFPGWSGSSYSNRCSDGSAITRLQRSAPSVASRLTTSDSSSSESCCGLSVPFTTELSTKVISPALRRNLRNRNWLVPSCPQTRTGTHNASQRASQTTHTQEALERENTDRNLLFARPP